MTARRPPRYDAEDTIARRAARYEALRDLTPWVRERMRRRRMTQRALAARAGVDHSTVSRLLSGDREPFLSTAIKIVDALSS